MSRRGVAHSRPAVAEPDSEGSRLYALPVDQFTAARNALASRLRKAGHAEQAEAVKALKKPTPPVWAINQVARYDPEAVREFFEAVGRLRAMQQVRRADDLEEATQQERAAFGRVVELVRRRLTEAGSRDSPDMLARATATLRGAAADPSRHDDLRHGTLKEELRAPGFEVFAGGMPPAEIAERVEKPVKRPRRDESVEERRERERRERAQEALRVAEAEVADWRRRAEELNETLAARRNAVDEVRGSVEELREQLAAAQERLRHEERSVEQAQREAERARRDTEKAEARLKAAERAVRAVRR